MSFFQTATTPTDPVERFRTLVGALSAGNPDLAPSNLEPVIRDAETSGKDPVSAVATYVAKTSHLTEQQATSLVTKPLSSTGDAKSKAAAASAAVAPGNGAAAAAGSTVDLELSDPVMLQPQARFTFAWVLSAIALVALIELGVDDSSPSQVVIGLGIIGVFALIGVLVLVMGYKNVTIKASPPAKSSQGTA